LLSPVILIGLLLFFGVSIGIIEGLKLLG
jgi:hypothetical protein